MGSRTTRPSPRTGTDGSATATCSATSSRLRCAGASRRGSSAASGSPSMPASSRRMRRGSARPPARIRRRVRSGSTSRFSTTRPSARGESGRAEVHLARRSRGAVDRRPERSRLLRLCDQLPRRHRQRDHRRRRDDARHPPGRGRRRAHHDRPHDGPLRPLPRAADRRQRLRLRADAGLARRGARDRAAHPGRRQVRPAARGASSAPTSPTTAAPTPTSVRRARRSGSSTGRPAPTARRAVASMPRA